MKYIIIVIFMFSITFFVNAETDENNNAQTEKNCLAESPIKTLTLHGYFAGWTASSGTISVFCDPPFLADCYTISWSITAPGLKKIVLNDGNSTEIGVSSEAVITTDELTGRQTHTFSE